MSDVGPRCVPDAAARGVAACWARSRRWSSLPDPAAQPPLQHLPWEHIEVLLDEVEDAPARDWYATAAVAHGWSRNVLLHQIKARSHLRGQAPTGAPVGAPPS
jgi:hypothetical protein